jgi:hypothetical protein
MSRSPRTCTSSVQSVGAPPLSAESRAIQRAAGDFLRARQRLGAYVIGRQAAERQGHRRQLRARYCPVAIANNVLSIVVSGVASQGVTIRDVTFA